MSTFTALNIEPDEHNEPEVDNTKEILVEEALKLFQSALKLHSQGPPYYEQAAEAYDALFKSEVFKYPESLTEFARFEAHPELENDPFAVLIGSDGEIVGGGDGPSTLPEIFYLAYKNHGQFILDCLRHRQRITDGQIDLLPKSQTALYEFSQALARDESDADLWRKAARIGGVLGSRRIARFCLEAAVEIDDDPTVSEVELPALEEAFAGEQLKETLKVLEDQTALSHPIMRPFLKKTMNSMLRKCIDPYPFLPPLPPTLQIPRHESTETIAARTVIEITEQSWAALGDALLQTSTSLGTAGTAIQIKMPGLDEDDLDSPTHDHMSIEQQLSATLSEAAKEATPNSAEEAVEATLPERPAEKTRKNSRQKDDSAEPTSTQNSRKRSQSLAGLQDSPHEDNPSQKRSRRIRNRETLNEPIVDPATQLAEQLQVYSDADEAVFSFVGSLLTKFGIEDLKTLDDLKSLLGQKSATESNTNAEVSDIAPADLAIKDLQSVLASWDDTKASTALTGSGAEVLGKTNSGPSAGLTTFLEHAKSGPPKISTKSVFPASENLVPFVRMVENEWLTLQDVVYRLLKTIYPSYMSHVWSDQMKHSIVRLISYLDLEIHSMILDDLDRLAADKVTTTESKSIRELVQTLFELHLDVYSKITNPNSVVDLATRIKTKDRLNRWAMLTADLMHNRNSEEYDELCHRYLWASAFFATMADGVSREHVLLIWTEMKGLLKEVGDPTIELLNNAVMPEVSAAAAEREISRLTTMDFFLSLFQPDHTDPASIIETLEPVLDPETALPSSEESDQEDQELPSNVPVALKDMWKFLQSGSTSLRLFLWQRLRDAYANIDYPTKEFSCYLKSIEIVVMELQSSTYTERSEETRQQTTLLTWLKALDELLIQSLSLALNEPTAFEVIDDRHIKSTLTTLASLARLLHSAAIFEDEVRVGMVQLPRTTAYTQGSFQIFQTRLREMQIRTWCLLYTVLKEGMAQDKATFTVADYDLADYLSHVHAMLGLRKYCKISNKIFLKMSKHEFIRLKHIDKIEEYIGQVLFDMYGLRLGAGVCDVDDHGCSPDPIDKRTTYNIADLMVVLAKRMSMKDLLKSDLRVTLEKMQQAIGNPKSTPQMTYNLRSLTEYLKSALSPQELYKGLKGLLIINSVPVTATESPLARNEWFFLMGNLALAKFRTQKRLSPGATDDLRVAATFLRLQLQFTSDHWESWFRLAQCFDAELEEDVMWSADKLNSSHKDIIREQRSAIHCYTMAISVAMQLADASFETASKISELHHDFGMRIYSSTREPFCMKAFQMIDFERPFSGDEIGMYKGPAHGGVPKYYAWQFAARLFKNCLVERPESWLDHYMYGKCLWKLFSRSKEPGSDIPTKAIPTIEAITEAFQKAIDTVPKPKDNRADPILEPHYKMQTIVHKLVVMGAVTPADGATILQRQPMAIRKGEPVKIDGLDEWEPFILESLRHLRSIDKSNWHHRIMSRVAHILWDEEGSNVVDAAAARQELRDSLFTKTMVVQVWKPEFERPGRHCVYMQRYVRFIVALLSLLNDKASMELLVKRVRKKQPDYFNFIAVWNLCCMTHCRLLRKHYDIGQSHDDTFKTVPTEEFEAVSDRLNAWIDDPNSSHRALDCLRETMELKKLNANLMKVTLIDDLVSDAWSLLYMEVGVNLDRPEANGTKEEPQPPPRAQGPMSLNNMMNIDGQGSSEQPPPTQPLIVVQDVVPRRTKTIGRREILRRAEAAINRPEHLPKPAGARGTPGGGRGGRRGAASRAAQEEDDDEEPPAGAEAEAELEADGDGEGDGDADVEGEGEGDDGEDGGEGEGEGDGDGDEEGEGDGDNEGGGEPEAEAEGDGKVEESSAPGSVHDSADDESDLSDVPDMDDVDPATIFSNDDAPGNGFGGSSTNGDT